jgi:hypothetical protein
VNWSVVREKGACHLDFLLVFYIPEENHFVTVNSNQAVTLLICNHGESVCKLRGLVLRHLDFLDSSFNVCLPKRRWFLHRDYMLKRLRVEDPDDSVSTCTVQSIACLVDRAAECPHHFDIHPLRKFALFCEDVEVAVRCQSIGVSMFACNSHENLRFYF